MLLVAGYALVGLAVFIGMLRFGLDLERKATAEERAVQVYVHHNLNEADIYLTPIKMQDFRLETGAAAYVDFKSHPYKDIEVIEWYRRVQLADDFYQNPACDKLPELEGEGITHIVLAKSDDLNSCQLADLEYLDDHYGIYTLKKP